MPHQPTIVALDSHPLDFDGISWSEIEALGRFSRFPRTTPTELLDRAANAEILIVNKFQLTAENLPQLPRLRCICVTATGTNNVDLIYCRENQIAVTNVKDYSAASVAQLVFSYLTYLATRVQQYNQLVQDGDWHKAPDFCIGLDHHWELAGKTIGIVGYGSIGRAVARVAEGFSMNVVIARVPGRDYGSDSIGGPERVDFDSVLAAADVLTLHVPLTEQTNKLINSKTIAKMKRSAILINTGRGDLVDEPQLSAALKEGLIAHACLDVVSKEPPDNANPLFSAPNTVITPHIAWSTREARTRLMNESAANIRAFLEGQSRNRVV